MPVKDRLQAIERDYRNTGVMIFGDPLAIEGIMETLDALKRDQQMRTRGEHG